MHVYMYFTMKLLLPYKATIFCSSDSSTYEYNECLDVWHKPLTLDHQSSWPIHDVNESDTLKAELHFLGTSQPYTKHDYEQAGWLISYNG